MTTKLFSVGPQGPTPGDTSPAIEFRNSYQWAADPTPVPTNKICIELPATLKNGVATYDFKIGQQNLRYSQLPYAEGDVSAQINAAIAKLEPLPDQTGKDGYFLSTDGKDAFWAIVNALPDQRGNAGKFLTTDGTDASWQDVTTESTIQVILVVPSDGTQFIYRLQESTTILGYQIRCRTGSFDVELDIDSTPITGLSGNTTTSSFVEYAATANNIGLAGQVLNLVISSSSTPSQGAVIITLQSTTVPSDPVQSITVILPVPADMTQFLYRFQAPATVLGYQIQCDTGSFDATVQLDGVDVTGLTGNTATSSFVSYAASGANSAALYSELELVVSGSSTPTQGKVIITYLPA